MPRQLMTTSGKGWRFPDGHDGLLPYYCFRHRRDQEGFTGRVQGHSTGITASRSSEVYEWLLAQPPLRGLTLAVRHARDS